MGKLVGGGGGGGGASYVFKVRYSDESNKTKNVILLLDCNVLHISHTIISIQRIFIFCLSKLKVSANMIGMRTLCTRLQVHVKKLILYILIGSY